MPNKLFGSFWLWFVLVWILCSNVNGSSGGGLFQQQSPEFGATFEQLVQPHVDHFELQTHYVITEDGYILTMYRIRSRNATLQKIPVKPVILLHGLYVSATVTIMASSNLFNANHTLGDNAGYTLPLTQRYEAWIPNFRGTAPNYHRTLHSSQREYWRFSFEEMALLDLPAVVDYVRGQTNRSSVAVIGGSLGATHPFVLLSMKPEYADRIKPFVAIAPIVYIDHINLSFYNRLVPLIGYTCLFDGEFWLTGPVMQRFIRVLCRTHWLPFCRGLITGNHIDQSRMPIYLSHVPASTSNRNACHLRQWFYSRRLARFDFGSAALNRVHYQGKTSVPDYPLHQIPAHSKIALVTSANDDNANPRDVNRLRQLLTKQIGLTLVHDLVIAEGNWDHLDLFIGVGLGPMLFGPIIDILDRSTQ